MSRTSLIMLWFIRVVVTISLVNQCLHSLYHVISFPFLMISSSLRQLLFLSVNFLVDPVSRKVNNGLRDIRISDLGVSWKCPVCKVVSRDHRQTQYHSQQPPIYQSWQPPKNSKPYRKPKRTFCWWLNITHFILKTSLPNNQTMWNNHPSRRHPVTWLVQWEDWLSHRFTILK